MPWQLYIELKLISPEYVKLNLFDIVNNMYQNTMLNIDRGMQFQSLIYFLIMWVMNNFSHNTH